MWCEEMAIQLSVHIQSGPDKNSARVTGCPHRLSSESPTSDPASVFLSTDQQYSWSPTRTSMKRGTPPAPRTMKGLSGSRNPPQPGHTCGLTPRGLRAGPPAPCVPRRAALPAQPCRQLPKLEPPLLPADLHPLDCVEAARGAAGATTCPAAPSPACTTAPTTTAGTTALVRPRGRQDQPHPSQPAGPVREAAAAAPGRPTRLQHQRPLPPSSAAQPRPHPAPGALGAEALHQVPLPEGLSKGHANGNSEPTAGRTSTLRRPPRSSTAGGAKAASPRWRVGPRGGPGSWWGSDDNLDSDSTCRAPARRRPYAEPVARCCSRRPAPSGPSLRTSKSNNDVMLGLRGPGSDASMPST